MTILVSVDSAFQDRLNFINQWLNVEPGEYQKLMKQKIVEKVIQLN